MKKKQMNPLLKGTLRLSIPNLEKASKIVAAIAVAKETSNMNVPQNADQ